MLRGRVALSFTTAQNIFSPPNCVTKKDFWKELKLHAFKEP